MFDNIFSSILTNGTFTGSELALSTLAALVCGLIIAGTFTVKTGVQEVF